MKKLIVVLSVIAMCLLGFDAVTNQYRAEFRAWAIETEAEKGGLNHHVVKIDAQDAFYYDNQAKGPVVVMLHGFSGSKTNWLRLAQSMGGDISVDDTSTEATLDATSDVTPDKYRIIAPDLLGHGENQQDLMASYHIADQVVFVNKLMSALKVESFHLVGNSMGGAISSLYAARHPDQVLSVTLISPAGVHDAPSEMDEIIAKGSNPLIAETEAEFYGILNFVMEKKPFIPDSIARAEAERAVARADINKKIFKDIRSDLELGLDKEFEKIKAPTLIIWGANDRVINAANIDKYAQLIAGAKKAIFPEIGHVAMIEDPQHTAQVMGDFLKSL